MHAPSPSREHVAGAAVSGLRMGAERESSRRIVLADSSVVDFDLGKEGVRPTYMISSVILKKILVSAVTNAEAADP